ncbi:DUF2778 domain-containing protein [Rhizobium sp. P32RR-XVIII]|uniref:DUF2778 domain-containing protein n=1 Tax=Rhizobium sp. P32RR-XVIII TaxID=2726738 RepID=UPI0014563F84|nr:DUF2778 domain-containing protein [Rhizobium sp. P32RR-XVIII]
MNAQFGERGTHLDFSGQAAGGLFRLAQPKPYKAVTTHISVLLADGRRDRRILSYAVWGAIAFSLGAFVAAGSSDICLAASLAADEAPDAPSVIASANPDSSHIDPGFSLRPTPISPVQSCPAESKFCLPPSAPAATLGAPANIPSTQAIPRHIQETWRAALPRGGAHHRDFKPMRHADRLTAVYDIGAHIVYMPNGERLEAHSGLGDMLDNPDEADEKNRGPTPPNVYDLVLREQLFHGVHALRLIPVGSGDIYGRDGLLAHSYMLGPQGFSNGCLVFKNYNKFLEGYVKGEVKRLVVAAHASLTGREGNSQRDGKQQVKVCKATNVRCLDRHRLGQKCELFAGCGAVDEGVHHEASRSARGGKGVGNNQPSRRPIRPAAKDS